MNQDTSLYGLASTNMQFPGVNAKWVLIHKIYEESVGTAYPVVQHNFFGNTRAEAEGYYQAHLKTDAFLRGCSLKGQWNGIRCASVVELVRLK